MKLSTYEIIQIAYLSRLLFQTDKEYRACFNVSFETIRDNQCDEDMMDRYYSILDRECLNQTGMTLRRLVTAYLQASKVYQSENFDWSKRYDNRSRRKFMRMLFRQVTAPTIAISNNEEHKFNRMNCDQELISNIFRDGVTQDPDRDLIFLILLTFKVVKPISTRDKRASDTDDTKATECVKNMIKLIQILRDDMPQIGVVTTPLIVEHILSNLANSHTTSTAATPAFFWALLNKIAGAYKLIASPNFVTEEMLDVVGYCMPGIWIDDRDKGEKRFWIFPADRPLAFCYQRDKEENSWRLIPYEFCFYSRRYDEKIDDICVFVTAEDNKRVITNPTQPIDTNNIAQLTYRCEREKEEISRIIFEACPVGVPTWMDWRSFTRLREDDERLKEYSELLSKLYDTRTTLSHGLINEYSFLTDSLNSLIAIDSDYLYISDLRRPEKFVLKSDSTGTYVYTPHYNTQAPPRNLLDLEMSDKHPLYVLPRHATPKRKDASKYQKLFEAIDSSEMSDHITIYRIKEESPIICFNRFSCIYDLKELMKQLTAYGAKCLTKLR